MRYQPIEVNGEWFVWDLQNPDKPPVKFYSRVEAQIAASAWNLLEGWTGQHPPKWEGKA